MLLTRYVTETPDLRLQHRSRAIADHIDTVSSSSDGVISSGK